MIHHCNVCAKPSRDRQGAELPPPCTMCTSNRGATVRERLLTRAPRFRVLNPLRRMIRASAEKSPVAFVLAVVLAAAIAHAQVVLPPGFNRAGQQTPAPAKEQPPPAKPQAQPPKPGQPPVNPAAAAQQAPAATDTPPQIAPASPAGALNLQNASLTEVIDILARQLKINYILDPRVRGGVTINTYGETKNMDNRALLDM